MKRRTIITVGMPVFNGELFIDRAIKSVLSQTFTNFQVIISDNASTDFTSNICEASIAGDPRIHYVRQTANIGATENFKFVLGLAKTKYFVFLADDDYWEPNFLEEAIANLELNADAVACISKVDFVKDGKFLYRARGDREICGTKTVRLNHYLRHPRDNSRFYSVFRRDIIEKAHKNLNSFHAVDWYIMAMTLLEGNHLCVDATLMHREKTDTREYFMQHGANNSGILAEYFPTFPMSFLLMKKLGMWGSIRSLWPIVRLNVVTHLEYVLSKHMGSFYIRIRRWF